MLQKKYLLSNLYYGPQAPLAVNSSGSEIELYAGDLSSALEWTVKASPEDSSWYNICTLYKNIQYCLDIYNDGTCPENCTTPTLAVPADDSGQQWILSTEQSNYYKLSNIFTGNGWYLDTYSGSKMAFMNQGNYTGQYWELSAVKGDDASSTTTSMSAMSTAKSTTSSPSRSTSTSSQPARAAASKSGLSTGAKAGIGVGVGLGILVLLVLGMVLWFKRKRPKQDALFADPAASRTMSTKYNEKPAELGGKAFHEAPSRTVQPNELEGSDVTRPHA